MAASGRQSEYVCSCPLLIVLIEVDNSHSVRDVYHAVAVHVGHADVDAAVVAAQVGIDDGHGIRHVTLPSPLASPLSSVCMSPPCDSGSLGSTGVKGSSRKWAVSVTS